MTKSNTTKFVVAKKTIRSLIFRFLFFLWTLWFLGQLFRDSTWVTSMFFYIPSPVLLLLMLTCAYYSWRKRNRQIAGVMAACALLPAVFTLHVENFFGFERERITNGKVLRLLHWNVFRGHAGWDGIANAIRQRDSDLCVLSEVPKKADIQLLASLHGQEYFGIRISNLAVIARGHLQDGKWLHHENGVKAYGIVWQSSQGNCRVLVVDLDANLLLARDPRLLVLRKLMVDWKADIVVGDFNAPRRSRALSPLPSGFAHAYETVGSGCSYTWPVPCPVYAIDQCILGQRVRPVIYDLESSWRSDHRQQILEFTIAL